MPSCFPNWPHHFTFSLMCSNFYTYVSELVFCLFGYSCSSGYEVIFIVVSVCTSLMANDFEHLSMFLFAICVSFSEKYIFEAFVQFFFKLFIYYWLYWVLYCVWAFFSCSEWELLSGCRASASHCSGFSITQHGL